MRILYIVPYAPSLIRVRSYQVIRHLAQRGHQMTVATLWTTPGEQAELQQLAAFGLQVIARELSPVRSYWNCLSALPTMTPLQASFCWQPDLADAILAELVNSQHAGDAGFDVIHVEHLRGARYGLWLQAQVPARPSNSRPPIVWDSVDCISHLFAQAAAQSRSLRSRLMTRLELSRTNSYEGWLQTRFDKVIVTSPIDKAALERLGQDRTSEGVTEASTAPQPGNHDVGQKIEVLPNGVDLDYFTGGREGREAATLVFSGKMSYHANVSSVLHLVNDIMPLIWAERPGVVLWIVGKDPAVQVRQLAARHAPRVQVMGSVPDIRPFLRRATVAACPMVYGAGIQNKVLEAMACGTPVVASYQAISALKVTPGRDLLLAEESDVFARQVLALLDSTARQTQLALAGRAYVEHHHSWNAIAAQLEGIYGSLLACRNSPACQQISRQ